MLFPKLIYTLKTDLSMYGVSVVSFSDPRLRYFNRLLAKNATLEIGLKAIIDIPMLTQMVQVCDSMYIGFVYKSAMLLAFFSFLRISNLVQHSI